jgi:hypothetical protein
LTRQLNKEELDLPTLSFSWCLCPGEYGKSKEQDELKDWAELGFLKVMEKKSPPE